MAYAGADRRDPVRGGGGPGWRFTEWLLGIVGGIGLFLGLFITFAGENEYVGLGGDWSWRVGDISSAWTISLLIGGGILLLASLAMITYGRRLPATGMRSRALSDLAWHAGIFVFVNAFIWAQDFAIGGGLDYAYWVTIPWALGLVAHAVAYSTRRERTEMPPLPPVANEDRELASH